MCLSAISYICLTPPTHTHTISQRPFPIYIHHALTPPNTPQPQAYLPYKRLIAQVILDKNAPRIRTVVNKVCCRLSGCVSCPLPAGCAFLVRLLHVLCRGLRECERKVGRLAVCLITRVVLWAV